MLFVHCERRAASRARLNGRQQQGDQDGDDGDDDEQLDQGKSPRLAIAAPGAQHGRNPFSEVAG